MVESVNDGEKREPPVQLVLQRYLAADAFQTPYRERWLRYYRLYRSFRDERFTITKNNNFVPKAFSLIETVHPRLTSAVLDQRPFVVAYPRNAEDIESAKMITDLEDYQFHHCQAEKKISNWIKECLLYGNSVIKVFYNNQADLTKNASENKPGTVMLSDAFRNNGPDIANVDLWDFFVDPGSSDIDSARWCIHKILKDREAVIREGEQFGYQNLDKLEHGTQTEKDSIKTVRTEAIGVSEPSSFQDKNTSKVEILDYWENDRHIVVANRSVLLLDSNNPYEHKRKPFLVIKDQEVPHEFFAIGEIESIESLHNKLLDYRNMLEDNADQLIHKMWKAQRGANINPDQLVSRAGGIVWTDDMDAIAPLVNQDIMPSTYNMISLIKSEIDEASGVLDVVKGTDTSSRTATATLALQQAAGNRFSQKVRNIKIMGIKPLAEMFWQLDVQYMPESLTVRILGPKGRNFGRILDPQDFQFKKITKKDIRIQPDFIPVGIDEPEGNRQARQQRKMQFFQILSSIPPERLQAFIPMVESIGRDLQIENVEEILQALIQAAQQQQQMAMLQLGGGPGPVGGSPPAQPGIPSLAGQVEAANGQGQTDDLVAGQAERIMQELAAVE